MPTRNPNLARLLEEWRRLYKRYGANLVPPELERLQIALKRRKTRITQIRTQIADLESQLNTLEAESEGVDKTMELVLSEAIASLLDDHVEAWSPVPVLGFRVWDVAPSGFRGYQQQWNSSRCEGECLSRGTRDEVPHTDGSCGNPPCGIYAVKDVSTLLLVSADPPRNRLAVGLVGMSGKVVEHELGYRAAVAEVLALGIQQREWPFLTADRWQIESLFRNTSTVSLLLDTTGDLESGPIYEQQNGQIIDFLRDQERRHAWTLASPSGS